MDEKYFEDNADRIDPLREKDWDLLLPILKRIYFDGKRDGAKEQFGACRKSIKKMIGEFTDDAFAADEILAALDEAAIKEEA